jgi:hypothetical protein
MHVRFKILIDDGDMLTGRRYFPRGPRAPVQPIQLSLFRIHELRRLVLVAMAAAAVRFSTPSLA